jgi:hypothetical protein
MGSILYNNNFLFLWAESTAKGQLQTQHKQIIIIIIIIIIMHIPTTGKGCVARNGTVDSTDRVVTQLISPFISQ